MAAWLADLLRVGQHEVEPVLPSRRVRPVLWNVTGDGGRAKITSMRPLTLEPVSGLSFQIGDRHASTSAVAI